VSDEVIQGAIACELVHLGSLYHDDVMDESTMRRGVDTVNAKWGNLQAIVAGDFLLARASGIAASLGNEIAGLLARTIAELCEGQIEELQHTYSVARTVPSYLVSIEGKTASLFATSARIGALVAGHDADVVDALTNYGTAFGMVFQIVDDILDVIATDEELGKRAGHDMEEGVYTLPVLLTLAQKSGDSDELRSFLGKPLSQTERERALVIVRAHSGIQSAIESANNYVHMAETECDRMPQGVATDALRAAPAALLASIIR
jgi:heptaprenyl diphosphate synthase